MDKSAHPYRHAGAAVKTVLLLGLALAVVLGTAGAASGTMRGTLQPGLRPRALTPVWTFSGGVYQSQPGDYTTPLSGVTVAIYGANSPGRLGTWIRETTTNRSGAYSLSVSGYDGDFAYYNIVETDLPGYTSTGALSGSGGEVVTVNWIRFTNPSPGGYAENFFWDVPVPTATPTPTSTTYRPTHTPSATPTRTSTATRTPSATPTATAWSYVWEFSGVVWVTPIQLPMPEVEVSLYGSHHPMELEQRLDVTETAGDGSFVLRYAPSLAAAQEYPYLILMVTDPEYRGVAAWSESGAEVVAGNRLVWHQPPPGRYGGNGFRVSPLRVYLPITMKQAGAAAVGASAATQYCTELLQNGGFETGDFANWLVLAGAPLVATFPYMGCCSAVLGYRDNADDRLSQSVVCPFDASGVIISGWIYVATEEVSGQYDWLTIGASWDWNGYPVSESFSESNASPQNTWFYRSWPMFVEDDPSLVDPGAIIKVDVGAKTDPSRPTSFFVDSLSLQVCCYHDTYEPYNDYANAVPLTLGAVYKVYICPNGDEDWFRFPVVQGQLITADLYDLPADLNMNLYSSPSRQLCTNLSGTFPEHCQMIADSTGEWRVRVTGARGATNNTPALLRVQVNDLPTATHTPTFTATRTPTRTATRTPTRLAPRRVSLPIIMKQRLAPGPTPTRTRTPTRTATRTPTPGALIFSDDFNDGNLAGWTANGGTWTNPGAYMRGSQPTGRAWNMRAETGSNVIYEGTVNLLSGKGAGLVARASADGTSSYCVILDAADNALRRCINWEGWFGASYPMTVQYNHPYQIKFVLNGESLEVYLDGVKRLWDIDNRHSSGQFGTFVWDGEAAFDNLRAWALP